MQPITTSLRRRASARLAALMLAFLLFGTTFTSAASAAGVITLSLTSGQVGSSVTVTGSSFARRVLGTVKMAGVTVAAFSTNSQGRFSAAFAVPPGLSGSVVVSASSGSDVASAAFVVVTPPPPTGTTGFVGKTGRQLVLAGVPYRFTGVNAYHLSTDYTVNYGCGEANTSAQIDEFFASLRPNSMVRFWAFQQLGWDKNTNSLNFTTFDRILASAGRYNQKVIVTLGNQWSGCGEVAKTEAWYAGGYQQVTHNGTSIDQQTVKLSYSDYVGQIVSRYANSAAIGMWEPINEPAAGDGAGGCSTTAAATLRSFFDNIGGRIHSLDPNHLVSSGLQGSGQCGSRNSEYQTLHQSAGLDVASYHDYGNDDSPMPGDQWNGLQVRLNQMSQINKPLFIGEVGIKARDGVAGCGTTAQRRDKFKAKMDAQFSAGIVGYMPWVSVKPNIRTSCTDDYGYDIESGQDVTLVLLHDYVL